MYCACSDFAIVKLKSCAGDGGSWVHLMFSVGAQLVFRGGGGGGNCISKVRDAYWKF